MRGTILSIIIVLAMTGLLVPGTCAVFPGGQGAGPNVTVTDLNVNGTDTTNRTLPAQYQTNPSPVRVEITVSETLIPGPKGKMQAGPRSIGFTLSPTLLFVFFLAAAVIGTGIWFIQKKRPAEEPAEESDGEEYKEEDKV